MSTSIWRWVRAGGGLSRVGALGLLAWLGPASGFALPGKNLEVTFSDIALDIGFQDRLSHGRAIVAGDFDNDGLTDFYLGNPGDPLVANDDSFILWNEGPDGEGKYHFRKGQILVEGDIAYTASSADYDNDGDEDIFVGIGGSEDIGLDHLFQNTAGVFTDVSESAGVRGPKGPDGNWVPIATTSGTWADYDNDGDLDLFVASREVPESLILPDDLGWRDSLFRNNGDGTFTDVTGVAGVGSTASSMTSSWGDFDNDGWMDLYIPVGWPHHEDAGFELYRNVHDGTFQRVALDPQDVAFGTVATWASSAADFNDDGWLDILSWARSATGIVEDSHALLINHGVWSFSNDAIATGLAISGQPTPRVMGGQMGDFDNDGDLDVVMANGGPDHGDTDDLFRSYKDEAGLHFEKISSLIDYPAAPDPLCVSPLVDRKQLWANQVHLVDLNMMTKTYRADGSAADCASGPRKPVDEEMDLCNPPYPYRGHGSVFVDLDGDGDLDLFMSKGGTRNTADSVEPNRVFRNDGGNANNWLFIRLTGLLSNRDGVGSRIKLVASKDGAAQPPIYREVYGGSGFSADAGRDIHFGLGQNDKVEEIEISWPSGIHTLLTNVSINQRLSVSEDVLLGDTFNDGLATGWEPMGGAWSVVDGEYRQETSGGRAVSLNPTIVAADSTLVAKLTYLSGTGHMAILARTSPDGADTYGVRLEEGQASLFKRVAGQAVDLGSVMAIEPIAPGRSYIVSLTCEGSTLRWRIDGKEGLPVTDSSIASGSFGVGTIDTVASFDNIAVY